MPILPVFFFFLKDKRRRVRDSKQLASLCNMYFNGGFQQRSKHENSRCQVSCNVDRSFVPSLGLCSTFIAGYVPLGCPYTPNSLIRVIFQ